MHAAFHDLLIPFPHPTRADAWRAIAFARLRARAAAVLRSLARADEEKVHIDDPKNPEYRKGRRKPVQERKSEPLRRAVLAEEDRRARFATQTARAEFGRFYWNHELGRRMGKELEKSRRLKREAAERARQRKRNGAGK
jgi:hypothetical protein